MNDGASAAVAPHDAEGTRSPGQGEGPAAAARGPRRAPESRPDQILDAATEILLAKGMSALTMDEIAGTAGLAKGTTYLYFKSKAQVLAALRIRHVQRMLATCHAAAADGQSATVIDRVERFVETIFEFTKVNAQLLFLLFHEAVGDDGTEVQMARDGLMMHVREGIASGEFDIDDPEDVVGFLVHGMHGVFADSMHREETDQKKALQTVKDVFRKQLLAGRDG
ncbi:TetR/AcrR family transcriptional regulator [Catenulispora rubra]|uniref:TetR/AcrR family transcriptional regulator n=1 Tax=Catenulispora rubra TaxID=280293 RepID=UPI00189240C4|nr:TetR/AcrR family transcriptional regulator [Catenulispora rubra]